MWACDDCLRRTWLLEQVSPYLEYQRKRIRSMLALNDRGLAELAEEKLQLGLPRAYEDFGEGDAEHARARAQAAGLAFVCRCDPAYPALLWRVPGRPAVLYIAGSAERFLELASADPVAIVGTRRPTPYGVDVARMLGRGVSASGLTVVSGLAIGVDRAAHEGALEAGARTISVLAGSAAEASPKANSGVYARIVRGGAVISELGPGSVPRRWTFVARNRIIAGLSRLTVVVQAREQSGTTSTIEAARESGRRVGAVPGSVLSRLSDGPNTLLAGGAAIIRHPQDVLDTVFGNGVREAEEKSRTGLDAWQLAVLEAVAGGADTLAALGRAETLRAARASPSAQAEPGQTGGADEELLVTLAGLELAGFVRRAPGGRYAIVA
jgi:DNA processing protein